MEFFYQSPIAAPVTALDAWHHRQGALARLTPPGEPVRVVVAAPAIHNGAQAILKVGIFPGIWSTWTAEHRNVVPGQEFTDVQTDGPFALWEHTHRFLPDPNTHGGSLLQDHVTCAIHGGKLANLLARPLLQKRLDRLFQWRHTRTKMDLESLQRLGPVRPQHILVSGASGMIGRALVPFLQQCGHKVTRLGRRPDGPDSLVWDPDNQALDLSGLAPVDCIIHLAGSNVAAGRWSARRRAEILNSRVCATRVLAEAAAQMSPRPAVFLSASGISCYAADGNAHDEASPTDTATFLGKVVAAWEAAADPARAAGIRVAHLRLGVVLSPDGGALAKLLPLFRLGFGGPIGHGQRAFSWIAVDDVLDVFHRACLDTSFSGAVNLVAPDCPTNAAFSSMLGKVLQRPAVLPTPDFLLTTLFGQMAEETLLADLRVMPNRLLQQAYPFRFPHLESALRHLLQREPQTNHTPKT